MRTVTFSDEKVVAALSKDFVCVWENRAPGYHECSTAFVDAETMRDAMEFVFGDDGSMPIGILASFMMTPDLEVLHYVAGYWKPAAYADELDFAVTLNRERGWLPWGDDAVRSLHGKRGAATADRYLKRVHTDFADGVAGDKNGHSPEWDRMGGSLPSAPKLVSESKLPSLNALRFRYRALDGQEESTGAREKSCGCKPGGG